MMKMQPVRAHGALISISTSVICVGGASGLSVEEEVRSGRDLRRWQSIKLVGKQGGAAAFQNSGRPKVELASCGSGQITLGNICLRFYVRCLFSAGMTWTCVTTQMSSWMHAFSRLFMSS